MARIDRKLPENAPGDFFVDSTCIDCGTCYEVAPATFARSDASVKSHVTRQPASEEERARAAMAVVACPTASIGSLSKRGLAEAARRFPEPLDRDVFYCGYAAEASFGASSYLIRRPRGNVLVDSPRAAGPLLARIDELGGVSRMFLSHQDDVADHRRFRERFGCERILHQADVGRDTRDVERKIQGQDPVPLAEDLLFIPLPGHTRGSAALLYRETFLFSGDSLWGSGSGTGLDAGRDVCWYSWDEQVRSLARLLDYRFEWVLPGHGPRVRAPSSAAMRAELERLLSRLRAD